MSGPPRKPSALRVLDGNRGHRAKLNKAEPKPRAEVPKPPINLKGEALAEWNRQAPELFRLGLLTMVDAPALAAYCQAYSRWQVAENCLARMAEQDDVTGALMIRTSKGTPVQNPLVGTARRAALDMVRYAAEFGMTPAARSRINANPEPGDDPLALLLRPRAG